MASSIARSLPVVLGPLDLTGLEVPDAFDRSGTMQPMVHRLIGGGRIVQLLGQDPGRRRLQGYFTGPDATERAQLLEALRDAGLRVPLAIGVWQEIVVVTSVVLRYAARGGVVQYLLEAEPLPGGAVGLVATAAAILASAGAQIASAATYAALLGSSSLVSGLASAASAVTASQSLMTIPSIDLAPVSSMLGTSIATSETAIASIVTAAPESSIVNGPTALMSALSATGSMAASVGAQSYAACASSSLAQLQAG